MTITQVVKSPLLPTIKKKLHKKQIGDLDETILAIMQNPLLGEPKVGDLKGVMVHKLRIGGNQFLLAYEQNVNTLFLLAFGVHENFYSSLKKYRKASG